MFDEYDGNCDVRTLAGAGAGCELRARLRLRRARVEVRPPAHLHHGAGVPTHVQDESAARGRGLGGGAARPGFSENGAAFPCQGQAQARVVTRALRGVIGFFSLVSSFRSSRPARRGRLALFSEEELLDLSHTLSQPMALPSPAKHKHGY